ncbi:LacI family DNA-binding transcriptional regulator [Brevibacterium casei]|uniref:DNA-binding transcriptional regulator, LacI/PurR family n=2 Tax=Brevibacterium casei TaxID=33889 RepID=A0A2H1IRJ3_9MICO|nr:LacI family DNA-binding transcriptional regulator [Brevibacterium casei]QPR39741.1 LacI family DNA-binding transcriptional regulator [Brevibacterium casei]QPR43905.1 LacI family DNA-binding transcriptional regulator [Brevibacterium casei]SMX77813.1 DNA-binding transcriptional regulator, LacI/PurR family [Brevibacterium casei CIP 102111]VEW15454.1 HTH-type transcriptional repressor CytR [Brevibacterium casei]
MANMGANSASGQRSRPTIRDVAARAGVSKSLVSLAFTDPQKVGPQRRELILEAAQALGYEPNFLARSLARDSAPFVGILVVNLRNPIFAEIAEAVRQELDLNGEYGLITSAAITGSDDPPDSYGRIDPRVIRMLQDLRPKALIVVGTVPEHEDMFRGIPTVYASAAPRPTTEYSSVRMDDAKGMELAVDHLVSLGHTSIGFIGGRGGDVSSGRAVAFADQMESRGLDPLIEPAGFSEVEGYRAANSLLARNHPPTAIVCVNDISAIGALAAADDAGLTVPDDLAVVGFDNIPLAALNRISLTSVDPQNREIGRLSAQAVLDILRTPDNCASESLIAPGLVIRGSTVKGPAADRP